MKKLALTASLLAAAGVGSVGCKTTPKLAWWKPDKGAESTAVAHTAPALPSDLAKPTPPAGATIGAAPQTARTTAPVSAMAAPGGYPSTDAPAFTPDVASRIALAPTPPSPGGTGVAPTTATTSSAASLGTIAASPYNPSLPPRPVTSPTGTATAPIPEPRYTAGSTTLPYGQPASGALAGAPGGAAVASAAAGGGAPSSEASIAGRYTPALPGGATETTAAPGGYAGGYASATVDPASDAAGRYNVTGGTATAASVGMGGVQPATAAVASAPYRPGGTGSYPTTGGMTTQAPVQVATRPQDGTVPTSTAGSTVPNVGRPGGTTFPQTTPTTTTPTRYW